MSMEVSELNSLDEIFQSLVKNQNIYFKNQQRNEADFTDEEKIKIAREIYDKSKIGFLTRFGQYLTKDQLKMFIPDGKNPEEDNEIKLILENLSRAYSENSSGLKIKNRRFEALKHLIKGNSYFSEVEMMKRNPLLYEQLVGQYLNDDERRERDHTSNQDTLVKILLEGMERDEALVRKLQQQEAEDNAMEESDSDDDDAEVKLPEEPKPSSSRWGEYPDLQEHVISKVGLFSNKKVFITGKERELLRDEFTSIMYANFLNGRDDFDYATIDNNEAYDNIDALQHDEEDKYFDSEEPDDALMDDDNKKIVEESSEDELDMYMNALNQHPTVVRLAEDLQNL